MRFLLASLLCIGFASAFVVQQPHNSGRGQYDHQGGPQISRLQHHLKSTPGLHGLRDDIKCHHPHASDITLENCKPGNPSSEWDVNGAGDPSIQGFSTDISYNVGQTAKFKVDTNATTYRVDIYRLGYYQGLGARKVDSVNPTQYNKQLPCFRDATTMLYDCKEWDVSAEWRIPTYATSGVYIARLVRTDSQPPKSWRQDNSQTEEDPRFSMPGGESMKAPSPQAHAYGALGHGKLRNPIQEPQASLIYFVVRNDRSTSDIVFQTSDTVWQAYNAEGGTSTYGSFEPTNPQPRAYKSSLNRPLNTRKYRPVNNYLGSEYPISRWLERNGYEVTYVAGVDTDRSGEKFLRNHKIFISAGHDEYWSGPQRKNVEEARDRHGMHLAFLSGNEMFWRIRWEDNYRVMVCYKESQSLTKLDPYTDEWTGTWRDARDVNPMGPRPENGILGQLFTTNAWRNDPLVVPFVYSRMRQWRNTKVARLQPGEEAVILPRGILGHEVDEDLDNGFRPDHLIHLSATPLDNAMMIMDHGSTYDSGSSTHKLTLYKHNASGSMVFGAGTVQWGWALDGFHDSETGIPGNLMNILNVRVGMDIVQKEDRTIEQFTVNLFGDMGVHPSALDSGLIPPHGEPHADPLHPERVAERSSGPQCRFIENRVSFQEAETAGGRSVFTQVEIEAAEALQGVGVIGSVELRAYYEYPCDAGEKRQKNTDGVALCPPKKLPAWRRATRTNLGDEASTFWSLQEEGGESPLQWPVVEGAGASGLTIEQPVGKVTSGMQKAGRVVLECVATDDSLRTQPEPTRLSWESKAKFSATNEETGVSDESSASKSKQAKEGKESLSKNIESQKEDEQPELRSSEQETTVENPQGEYVNREEEKSEATDDDRAL